MFVSGKTDVFLIFKPTKPAVRYVQKQNIPNLPKLKKQKLFYIPDRTSQRFPKYKTKHTEQTAYNEKFVRST